MNRGEIRRQRPGVVLVEQAEVPGPELSGRAGPERPDLGSEDAQLAGGERVEAGECAQ